MITSKRLECRVCLSIADVTSVENTYDMPLIHDAYKERAI